MLTIDDFHKAWSDFTGFFHEEEFRMEANKAAIDSVSNDYFVRASSPLLSELNVQYVCGVPLLPNNDIQTDQIVGIGASGRAYHYRSDGFLNTPPRKPIEIIHGRVIVNT